MEKYNPVIFLDLQNGKAIDLTLFGLKCMLLRIFNGKVKNFVMCGENLPFVEICALWRGYYLYSLWNFYPRKALCVRVRFPGMKA